MDLAIASVAAVALAVGGLRAADGHIGVGSLLIILLLGNGVFHPVRELGKLYHQYLFNTSIRENIWLGKPDATDDEIEAAARARVLLLPPWWSDRSAKPTSDSDLYNFSAGDRLALTRPDEV